MDSALIFGGVAVSLVIEFISQKFGPKSFITMALVVLFSLLGGVAFYFLKMFGLWEASLQILVSAGAFYAFIIRNISTQ